MTTDFAPTAEQRTALDLFAKGESMVIVARAGAGKTSTLRLIAESTDRAGRYLAYNKAIAHEVAGTLPRNCAGSTAHALAFRALGHRYERRLNAPRMRGWEIAERLDVPRLSLRVGDGFVKVLSEGYLAGVVMKAIEQFCRTADDAPSRHHVQYIDGIDFPDDDGTRRYENNNRVAAELEPCIERAWADIQRLDGGLPYKHDYYLKAWQLTHPQTAASFIMLDEAQDANPVIAAIMDEQQHAQRVYVGDPEQEIYGWAGAVDALSKFQTDNRTYLTQTFRFGNLVAEEANKILRRLNAEPLVRGHAPIASTVGPLGEDDRPDVVLCRSNAGAVNVVLDAQRHGVRAALVGGGKQVVSFAEGAQRLMNGEQSWHPDLSCFDTWQQVCDYVSQDAQGRDLKLLVDLVEEFGTETIIDALGKMPDESRCDLVASTAHKAKGRQWGVVQLHTDFAPSDDRDPSESELRLQYVAVTRAQQHLDCTVLDRPAPARTLTVVDGEADSTEGDRPEVRQIRSGTF